MIVCQSRIGHNVLQIPCGLCRTIPRVRAPFFSRVGSLFIVDTVHMNSKIKLLWSDTPMYKFARSTLFQRWIVPACQKMQSARPRRKTGSSSFAPPEELTAGWSRAVETGKPNFPSAFDPRYGYLISTRPFTLSRYGSKLRGYKQGIGPGVRYG